MDTAYLKIDSMSPDPAVIARAGRILKEGGLVAFPTETVYGLGGDAFNASSSRRIYEAKGRPSDNPLIVHICRFDDITRIASNVPEAARTLADAFWPGPLTMILPKDSALPAETTGGLDTVAVRFPSHPVAAALIDAAGGFVAAPSANRSGRPSTTSGAHCLEDLDGRVDMILDAGEVGIGLESTIVDLTTPVPEILRPGYVTKEMLRKVLGEVETDRGLAEGSDVRPRAPGMKYRHYAPRGVLTVVEGDPGTVTSYINARLEEARAAGKRSGVICTDETAGAYRADVVESTGARADEESAAHNLFRILRDFDARDVEVIYAEAFPEDGLGGAIMNRLLKAAGHNIVYPGKI
ncbi:MAG: threonylcarbamoyl-AMP synthase [Lachnospiraceae bacterium]|nr:threonylcarbamoyl-AMP synthase [Lachnospiraceae bacterium]